VSEVHPNRIRPRISINKLAQYMSADAARRERILREQKHPPAFKVAWYADASQVIRRYLMDPQHDTEILRLGSERIRMRPVASPNERQKRNDNGDAVDAFAGCCQQINFDDFAPESGPESGNLMIEGVRVSVRPEVVIAGRYRGQDCRGALKVYLAKNDPLDGGGADIIGALLQRFMSIDLSEDEQCLPRHCTVIDTFRRQCFRAPTAIIRHQRNVDAACREIANRWPAL
jgi:hypothetical protein